MDIKEIRAINLKVVVDQIAPSKKHLAESVDTAASYISQLLNPEHKATVGDDLARRIEAAYGLPHGWMDNLHDPQEADIAKQREEYLTLEQQLTEEERQHINELMRLIIEKRKILKKLL